MRIILVACVLAALGCTGSLESARKVGAAKSSPARCETLDDRRQFASMVGKGAAVLAGASGLASIPVHSEDKAVRYGVAGGAVLSAAVAAGAMVVAEGASESWVRECQ